MRSGTGHEQGTRPHVLPEPTAWPATIAAGITLAAAGLVTSPLLLFVGGAVALVGLAGWASLLLEER